MKLAVVFGVLKENNRTTEIYLGSCSYKIYVTRSSNRKREIYQPHTIHF